ncbi:MAG: hypothetical protein ACHQYP_10390 [Nitrospiria bacterium]
MKPPDQNIDHSVTSSHKGMENLVTCPKCKFVYDIRYLSESCRFDEQEGYKCMNCNSVI